MITKKIYGQPFETFSVIEKVREVKTLKRFTLEEKENCLIFRYKLGKNDIIYGLGQTMNGINKRGDRYVSFNTDNPNHFDGTPSLYGSHNFFVVDGEEHFGVFVDTPSRVFFDFDYQNSGLIEITCETKDLKFYQIDGENSYDVTKQFLKVIGKSFIPPLWAFGYIQSRWGYVKEKDFREVARRYKETNIPLDGICMDIDYMRKYIDFTIDTKKFPDFKKLVSDLKDDGVHLIPIIDAAVKAKKGEETRDEGVEKGMFCKKADGKLFEGVVWPGFCYFPDFCKPETREWFGSKFKKITDNGVDGFWIDMNEPSIFFMKGKFIKISDYLAPPQKLESIAAKSVKTAEYNAFYQEYDGRTVKHYDVHNVYGHFMQMAAGSGLEKTLDKRYLLFSRSTYIGSHRYGGMWTGDNKAKWEHLRRNLTQMVGLNMSGLLYSGADTGGFSDNCGRELLIRWHALSVFTPLFRNHAAKGTALKECYQFDHPEDFKNIINLRYRLMPYIYSEFVKAALNNDMYFKPLSFVYDDEISKKIEDQILVGDSIMIAPVMQEGQLDRKVYLPEKMTMVTFDGENFKHKKVKAGEIEIHVELNEVVFFIRNDKLVPISKLANSTKDIDLLDVKLLGDGHQYLQYVDDGYTKKVSLENIRVLTK